MKHEISNRFLFFFIAFSGVGIFFSPLWTVSTSLSFWVLPMNILLPVLIGLLLFVLVLYFGVKAHIRKKMRELSGGKSERAAVPQPAFSRLALTTIGVLALLIVFLVFLFFALA